MKAQKPKRFELMYAVSENHIKTYNKAYLILLSIIFCLELVMSIRALIYFDFSKWYSVTYFVSYVVLMLASAVTLGCIIYNRRRKTIYKVLTKLMNGYSAIIILWSATITFVDITKGNTMIVYMTIIMCVAAVVNVNPFFYTALVVPCSAALLIEAYAVESPLVDSSGYQINFGVYVLFAVILVFIQNRLTAKSFLYRTKLEDMSYHDQLTGVYNRHTLKSHFANIEDLTVYQFGIVDVDDFKNINDSFGHDVGDDCLVDIAKCLKNQFGDKIYRYGGDEFVIITDKSANDTCDIIDSINLQLKDLHGDRNVHISAGFYNPKLNAEPYSQCFKNADRALYTVKQTQKGKAAIYTDDMN